MNNGNDTYTILKEISLALLAEGKTIRAKAEGYSMYPFIKPGSMVLLEPVNDSTTLIPGEIIAWKRDSGFVLHRLTAIIKSGNEVLFITRGDSCMQEDKPLSRELISGRVLVIEDKYGNSRKGPELIVKPRYLINRTRVWLFFKWKRVSNITARIYKSDERKG